METKSFLIEEHESTVFDLTEMDQWHDLVQVLGLEKQAELVKVGSSLTFAPFPAMTEAESTIFKSVLDRHTDYREFSGEAIPLKILSLIALCEKEKYFDKIQIWHSREIPDPLVVGLKYQNEKDREEDNHWRALSFKIGVWGDKIKSALDLLPAWKEMKESEHARNYEYYMNSLKQEVERFKFQLGAVEPARKGKQ